MSPKKDDALQVFDPAPYPVLVQPDATTAITQAFSELGVGALQLNRLKLPTGGGKRWLVNTLTGELSEEHLDVVIAGVKGNEKVWWRVPFDQGGGGPPSCVSHDGVTGRGFNTVEEPEPGAKPGEYRCAECPWGQWGSDRKPGPGKDCKDTALLLFFREGTFLPELLIVPPSSLDPLLKYSVALASAGKNVRHVLTRMSLTPDKSAGGIAYSKLALSYQSDLGEAERQRMDELSNHVMQSVMPTITITSDDLQS